MSLSSDEPRWVEIDYTNWRGASKNPAYALRLHFDRMAPVPAMDLLGSGPQRRGREGVRDSWRAFLEGSAVTDQNGASETAIRIAIAACRHGLDEEIRDLRARVRALEKRVDQDDAIRDKLREIAASAGHAEPALAVAK